MSARIGRRVRLSEALEAMLTLAERRPEAMKAALARQGEPEGTDAS